MNPIPVENQRNLLSCADTKSISSFEALYDKYAPALLGVIHTEIIDHQEAIEVLQLSFTQIWERMDEYPPGKMQLFTWLYQLTKSVVCAYKLDFINYTSTINKPDDIKKTVALHAFAKSYSRK